MLENVNRKLLKIIGGIILIVLIIMLIVISINAKKSIKIIQPMNFESGEAIPVILKDFGYVQPSKKLFIDRYFLFYYFSGKTYYYNLNTYDYDVFCEGELEYLDSENNTFLSLSNGNVYRGVYYEDTLSTRQINKLTTSAMNKLYEDDDNLYSKKEISI